MHICISIAKGELSGQNLKKFGFNSSAFLKKNEFWFEYLKDGKTENRERH